MPIVVSIDSGMYVFTYNITNVRNQTSLTPSANRCRQDTYFLPFFLTGLTDDRY